CCEPRASAMQRSCRSWPSSTARRCGNGCSCPRSCTSSSCCIRSRGATTRGALIDDCTLAAALKRARPPISIALSHSVRSLRVYAELGDFWQMVSRSAFTQLRYSMALLALATVLMAVTLLAPAAGVAAAIVAGDVRLAALAAVAWLALAAAYWPVVRFYGLSSAWAATLPVAAALFLAMTWDSALRYWRGTGAHWKARDYGRLGERPRPQR